MILALLLMIAGGINLANAQGTGGTIDSVNKFARPSTVNAGDPVNVNVSINALPCVPPYSVSVALVIDKSGSMTGTPLAQALSAASLFVDTLDLSRDEASVVAFSGDGYDGDSANDADTLSNLSQDRGSLISAISSIQVDENTNIYEGLNQGGATLTSAASSNAHALVLLTDGVANIGAGGMLGLSPSSDALTKATELKNQGIRIYTIGLGQADANFLKNIATSASDYYASPTPAELPTIYAQIARSLLSDIGTDATFVETYDNTNFEIIDGSQVPTNGVIDSAAGTITWDFPTLGSRQGVSYQVRALTTSGTYDISRQTDITYTQATSCSQQGQQLDFSFGTGATAAIGQTQPPTNAIPANVTVSLIADPNQAVAPSDVIAYTFTATNRGKGTADETKITLPFDPSVVELVDATFSRNTAWVSQVNTSSVEIKTGTLSSGNDSVSGTVRFRVLGGTTTGTQLNTQASFTWSDAAGGGSGNSNTVTVTVSDQSATQPYATLTVTPYSASAGDSFEVKGTGFIPNEPVTLWYNTPSNQDVAVKTVNANADGEIELTFSATSGLAPGNYAMVAYGNWSAMTAVGVFQIQ
ncbi:VWA domain-containing protein [Oscillochloris sp. ZM17-4]|uniref:vWA domain-containing protein n=1 Tax=Oscillochloris sp. ZM17-4 TaxID=2866714 RepID=UPI001C7332F2|nr:vWA domain-containing protein [Oscillochloris sp. ZM17-4]MBX0328311.1 VWA domain-containing protein [Oscillochloris sp. ZM17-4]